MRVRREECETSYRLLLQEAVLQRGAKKWDGNKRGKGDEVLYFF